jgi:hypothetical protein
VLQIEQTLFHSELKLARRSSRSIHGEVIDG